MCGIFGFKLNDKDELVNQQLIKKFRSNLYLRGPDAFDYKSIKNHTIGISRLSIVDINNQTQPYFLQNSNIC